MVLRMDRSVPIITIGEFTHVLKLKLNVNVLKLKLNVSEKLCLLKIMVSTYITAKFFKVTTSFIICDVIKRKELDVGNIDFELQANICDKCLCFILF